MELKKDEIRRMRRDCRMRIGLFRIKPHNLSYKGLAEVFGVHPSTVKNALNYRENPKSLELLKDIHTYLTEHYVV